MERSMTKARWIPVAVAAAMFATTGCAKETDKAAAAPEAAPPVAVVNGKPISREVFDMFVHTRSGGRGGEEMSAEDKAKQLDELINMYVAAQQAQKDGLDKGEDGARLELMHQSALADLAGRKFLEGKEPTEEEMRAEYDKQVAQLPKLEYRARHILVADEAKAKELIAELDKGASFETLAKENSSDSSAQEGGDLGWFAPNRMVKPFADAVQALEKGKYTATPVKSEFGWHIIKLEETRDLAPPPYEMVQQQLGQLVRQSKFQAYLDELMKTAKVEKKL
jgi:peptidyl-prolyl cis-trans isomerase C